MMESTMLNKVFDGTEFRPATSIMSFSDFTTELSDRVFVGEVCLTTLNSQEQKFELPYPEMANIVHFIASNIKEKFKVFMKIEVENLLADRFTIETTQRGFDVLSSKGLINLHFTSAGKNGFTFASVSLRKTGPGEDVYFFIKY